MIFVDRANDPRPEAQPPAALDLDEVTSPAYVERAKAINYYDPPDPNLPPAPHNPLRKPSYSVYGRSDVKAALFNLFHDKCAYCEAKISGNQTGDIEHYRPKGSIKNPDEAPLSPGYYWLAADWTNLFLSCQSCNTARKEPELQADGTWTVARDATGKKDQFPLSDPNQHVRSPHADLAAEEPFRLLLDPCTDRPEDFLRYNEDGDILPRADDEDSHAYKKADRSIAVFDLKRYGLKQNRRKHYLAMLDFWKNVQTVARFVDDYDIHPPEVQAYLQTRKDEMRDNLARNGDKLIACVNGDQVFAGFCRYVLSELVAEVKALQLRFEQVYGG